MSSRIVPLVLYQEVAERIRQRIYDHDLKPGEWIDEQALAESFGISRTPLREALKVLNSEGLVVLAVCEILPRFDVQEVWERLAQGDLTLFMAVPTVYVKLIAAWEKASPAEQKWMSAGCRKLRLMVSGSAALPVPVLEKWQEISGHVLLERYGMTEIGMALSNSLKGPRYPGCVGTPLTGVAVRLTEQGSPVPPGTPGEIEVKGPAVFHEYWGQGAPGRL